MDWKVGLVWSCLLLSACAAEGTGRRDPMLETPQEGTPDAALGTPECSEGARQSCACFGSVGYRACVAGALGECVCPDLPDASVVASPTGLDNCDPGIYEGTFSCDYNMDPGGVFPVHVEGPVGFNLQADEKGEDPNCQEFCVDLVIKEGSSRLFGLAGILAFEATLEGGLDCRTGEFRASIKTGQYGGFVAVDPSDPNSELAVAQPPFGSFTGSMGGLHDGKTTQQISGNWALAPVEIMGSCDGPFMLALKK